MVTTIDFAPVTCSLGATQISVERDPANGQVRVLLAGSVDLDCAPLALSPYNLMAAAALVVEGIEAIPDRLECHREEVERVLAVSGTCSWPHGSSAAKP